MMDAKEEALQLKKLEGIDKMILLLEEIAFNTSSKITERNTYLERIYASRERKTAEVHGRGVGPQASGQADKNQNVGRATLGLRQQADQKPKA